MPRNSVAKWPDIGATSNKRGCSGDSSFLKRSSEPNGAGSEGRDVYDVRLPAVVTVLEGINLPRYPSVPAKLRARQKPVDKSSTERPDSRLEKLRLVVPGGPGKQAEILGEGAEAAPAVVGVMRDLGVA